MRSWTLFKNQTNLSAWHEGRVQTSCFDANHSNCADSSSHPLLSSSFRLPSPSLAHAMHRSIQDRDSKHVCGCFAATSGIGLCILFSVFLCFIVVCGPHKYYHCDPPATVDFNEQTPSLSRCLTTETWLNRTVLVVQGSAKLVDNPCWQLFSDHDSFFANLAISLCTVCIVSLTVLGCRREP